MNNKLDNKLGNLIKEERLKKGISQRELARMINISKSYMNKIETGVSSKPNFLILVKLSKELEMDLNKILESSNYDNIDLDIIQDMQKYDVIGGLPKSKKEKYINNDKIDVSKVLDDYKMGKLDELETLGLFIEAMELSDKIQGVSLDYTMYLFNKSNK